MTKLSNFTTAYAVVILLAATACGSGDPYTEIKGRKEFRLTLTATNSSSNAMDVSATLPFISESGGCNDADGSIAVAAHATGTLIVKHLCLYQPRSFFQATITNSAGTGGDTNVKKTFSFEKSGTGTASVTCDDTGCDSPDATRQGG